MSSAAADLILYGGPILTMEASQPRAKADVMAHAGPATSITELQQVLREHVARHPVGKGEWVIAYGYDVDGL
jgi:predicted amidohydrolase YtcJ